MHVCMYAIANMITCGSRLVQIVLSCSGLNYMPPLGGETKEQL